MSFSAALNPAHQADASALLIVENLSRSFRRSTGLFSRPLETRALSDVTFGLKEGEILGIVGESGSGKSTLARIVAGLDMADSGRIVLDGKVLVGSELKRSVPPSRRGIQMVFQDPYSSLNPRMRVGEIVAEGLSIAGISRQEKRQRTEEALEKVGLRASDSHLHAHQFSGGQRQRIGIARALAMRPRLMIADEAVSALDVSVQMQILNLLLDIKESQGISVLFITHDISVVEYICDRVVVLNKGVVVESASAEAVTEKPRNAYTRKLISAVPRL